jgi:hypothetical protein
MSSRILVIDTPKRIFSSKLKDVVDKNNVTNKIVVIKEDHKHSIINNKSRLQNLTNIYVDFIRKIILPFLLFTNLVSYGLNIEFNHFLFNWEALRIIEISLLLLLTLDLLIINKYLYNFVNFYLL